MKEKSKLGEFVVVVNFFGKEKAKFFFTAEPIEDYKKERLDEYREVGSTKIRPNPATTNRELKGFTKALIMIALNTAMRKNEILSLRWNDIDFIDGFIHIKESKPSKIRKVPMNSVVADVFKNIKRQGDFIFHNPQTGTRMRDFYRSWKKALKDAGIKDFRFHDLRHTSATLMVTSGVDLVTVKEILGHADIKMTMKYTHPTPENKRRAVNVLASIFESGKEEKMVKIRSKQDFEDSISYS